VDSAVPGSELLNKCLRQLAEAERSLASVREGINLAVKEASEAARSAAASGATAKEAHVQKAPSTPPASAAPADDTLLQVDAIAQQEDAIHKLLVDNMSSKERVMEQGVLRSDVKKYLRRELREADACMQLPIAILLFVFFTAAVFVHDRVETLHAVDKSITWDIEENANFAFSGIYPYENGRMGHKNLMDVNSLADFWSWLDLGIVPIFWPEGWDISETRANVYAKCVAPNETLDTWGFPSASIANLNLTADYPGSCPENDSPEKPEEFFGGTPTYLFYNTIIGGMRMRQEYTDPAECPGHDADLTRAVHNGECVPYLGYWLMPEVANALQTDESKTNHPKAQDVYLLSGLSQKLIRSQLRALENSLWLNPRTAKVELQYTTYNPHLDLFTSTFVLMFVNRGGHIHKIIEPVSVWVHPYFSYWNYILDFAFCALVMKVFIDESREIFKHMKQLGVVRGVVVYMNWVNFVDWVNIVFSFVIVGYWIQHLTMLNELQGFLKTARHDQIGSWATPQEYKDFFKLSHDIVQSQRSFRNMLSLYPFVIVLRFFKAFNAQPRLAMVTKTLQTASTEIIHFGVVFGIVFLIYTISGMILFGQEMLEFANLGRAWITVFRCLLGDFDWEAMTSVGRPQAGVWFVTFMVLVNLIMLNMLLAIVMDVYTEVKGSVGSDAPTLLAQLYEIFFRLKEVRAKRQIHLQDVLMILDPTSLDCSDDDDTEEDEMFSIQSFKTLVPGLSDWQAESILVEADEAASGEKQHAMSVTDMTLMVRVIDERVMALYERLMRWRFPELEQKVGELAESLVPKVPQEPTPMGLNEVAGSPGQKPSSYMQVRVP